MSLSFGGSPQVSSACKVFSDEGDLCLFRGKSERLEEEQQGTVPQEGTAGLRVSIVAFRGPNPGLWRISRKRQRRWSQRWRSGSRG